MNKYCRKCGRNWPRQRVSCTCGSKVFSDKEPEILVPIDSELNEQIKELTRRSGLNVTQLLKVTVKFAAALVELIQALGKA